MIEKIANILQYLDEQLHPIISPEHWNVYSELHDMISGLSMESKWTLCSTELPKKTGLYMVTVQYDNGDYDVDIYEYDAYRKEWNDGDIYSGEVMAWQAKPKPWKVGDPICNSMPYSSNCDAKRDKEDDNE